MRRTAVEEMSLFSPEAPGRETTKTRAASKQEGVRRRRSAGAADDVNVTGGEDDSPGRGRLTEAAFASMMSSLAAISSWPTCCARGAKPKLATSACERKREEWRKRPRRRRCGGR